MMDERIHCGLVDGLVDPIGMDGAFNRAYLPEQQPDSIRARRMGLVDGLVDPHRVPERVGSSASLGDGLGDAADRRLLVDAWYSATCSFPQGIGWVLGWVMAEDHAPCT